MDRRPGRLARRARALVLSAALLCAADALSGGAARAQDAAEERAQSFRAVEGAVKEDVPGGPLLVAAYAALWVALLGYVFRIVRLQQRAQRDVERLERALAAASPRDPAAG